MEYARGRNRSHCFCARPSDRNRRDDSVCDHYGRYEVTRLKQLAGRYRTRETEVAQLLCGGAFVNLYDVARDVVRIGDSAYSIMDLEAQYRPIKRAGTLGSGISTMVF